MERGRIGTDARFILFAASATLLSCSVFAAEDRMEMRGRNYACRSAQEMQLWDISGDSPLIRRDMVAKNYCWRTPEGIAAHLIERVGKFALMQHQGGGLTFFVYGSDLMPIRPVKEPIQPKAPPKEIVSEVKPIRVLTVKNSSQYGVALIAKNPTVSVRFDAGGGLQVDFTIRKDRLTPGFSETIKNQRGENMVVGGQCKTSFLGLSDDDSFSLKVLSVDSAKKVAEFEVSGEWHRCDKKSVQSYRLLPGRITVKGGQFDELLRPHTPQEMMKTHPG